MQLLLDVPDDYEPYRQVRPNTVKRKSLDQQTAMVTYLTRPKKPKLSAVKCVNRCGRAISSDDPTQIYAILCPHQNETYSWIDEAESCRRWLCNYCRIQLAIPINTNFWFCDDHCGMPEETAEIASNT